MTDRGRWWKAETPRCTAMARTKGRRCYGTPLPTFDTCGLHTSLTLIRERLAALVGAAA